jgi:hypothetical protein
MAGNQKRFGSREVFPLGGRGPHALLAGALQTFDLGDSLILEAFVWRYWLNAFVRQIQEISPCSRRFSWQITDSWAMLVSTSHNPNDSLRQDSQKSPPAHPPWGPAARRFLIE